MSKEGEALDDNTDIGKAEESSPVVLQEASKNNLILELKKKALACKQAGETAEALEHLKDSKRVGAASTLEDLLPNKSLQCSYLRSLAAHLKAANDIPGALASLKQAKEIELQQQQEEAQIGEGDGVLRELEDEQVVADEPSTEIVFTDEEMIDHETMAELQMVGMDVPSQETYQARILEHKKKALALKQKNDIAGATAALRIAKQLKHAMDVLAGGRSVTDDLDGWGDDLTAEESALLGELVGSSESGRGDAALGLDMDDENGGGSNDLTMKQKMDWQDLESMEDTDISEFLEMGIVDLPTVANLLEMADSCQKEALEFKQSGNIAMAKAKLVESKKIKLQATRLDKIYNKAGSDDGGAVVTDEDLENLMSSADGSASYLQPKTSAQPKPDPKPVNPWMLKSSVEIKAEVVRLKNAKKVKEATALLKIFKQVLQKENDAKEAAKKQAMVAKIQREIDLCLGQLQLYSFYEGFVDKATGSAQSSLWKQYQQHCRKAIQIIEKEGSGAIKLAYPKASGLVAIQSSGSSGDEDMDNQHFVSLMIEQGTPADSLEGKMEAAIVQAFRLEDNKTVQKLIKKKRKELGIKEDDPQGSEVENDIYRKIQVDGKVQLPPGVEVEAPSGKDESQNESGSPQWTTFSFPPLAQSLEEETNKDGADGQKTAAAGSVNSTVQFTNSSKKVWLPRGDTTKERSLIRRMERKKVEFHLNYNPNITEKQEEKSSWFWKKETKEPSAELPISHLGKVVLELKYLLNRNCIAGDFPLVVNNKPVGGFARLCLRTDAPLDPTQFEPLDTSSGAITKIKAHSKQLIFSRVSAAEI